MLSTWGLKGPDHLVRAFLFVVKRLHGIKLGGARGGIEPGNRAAHDGQGNGYAHRTLRQMTRIYGNAYASH